MEDVKKTNTRPAESSRTDVAQARQRGDQQLFGQKMSKVNTPHWRAQQSTRIATTPCLCTWPRGQVVSATNDADQWSVKSLILDVGSRTCVIGIMRPKVLDEKCGQGQLLGRNPK